MIIYTTAVRCYNILNFHIFSLSLSLSCVSTAGDLSITFFSSLAQFKNKRPQQKLIYGEPGKIRCTAEGFPRPQFEWSKNNSPLLEDDRFTQLSDGSLQIDTVGREDNGAYKCSIKQTKGSERITVYFQDISVSVVGG